MLTPATPADNTSRKTSIIVGVIPEGAHGSLEIPDLLSNVALPLHMRLNDPNRALVRARACKIISPTGEKLSDYAAGNSFHFEEHHVATTSELFGLIEYCAREDRVVVMGELTDPWRSNQGGKFSRRSTGSGGTIAKQPSRLLTIDLDGATIPGFDPENPLEGIDAYVMPALGEPFTRCGYVCQLTTGQRREVGSPARVRLWMLTKDPMSFDGRTRLLKQLALIDEGLKVDKSSCNIVQLNYTSPPIVIPELTMATLYDPLGHRVPDIFARRLHLKAGDLLEVEEPAIEAEWRTESGERGSVALYAPGSELEALETDGDEIHDKVRACTLNLARNQGNVLTADEVANLVIGRLMSLSEPGQPLEHRRSRIVGSELRLEVRNAYMGAVKKASLRSVGLHTDNGKGIPLPEAEKLLSERFCEAVADQGNRIHVIKATCGLGKTRTALQEIKKTDGVCYLFVPNHDKAAEVVIDAKAMDIPTMHIRGKSRLGEDGLPLCMKVDAIAAHPGSKQHRHVESGMVCTGVKIEKIVDPSWGSTKTEYRKVDCPYFLECGYNRQFLVDAKLYVFAHASMMHAMNQNLPKPVMSIIDEDPCTTLRQEEEFAPGDLFDWDDVSTAEVVGAMAEAVTAGRDLMAAFLVAVEARAEWLGEDFTEVGNDLIKRIRARAKGYMRRKMGGITPDMDAKETFKTIGKRPVSAPWVSIVEVIDRCWSAGATTSPEIRLENNTTTSRQKVTVRRMVAPKCTLGQKVILLDATPHEVGLRHLFGGFKMHEFEVQENCFEVQVLNPSFSDDSISRILEGDKGRFNDLMSFTRMVGKEDGAGVVTRKKFAESLPLGAGGYDIPVMTFGALRGQNALESRSVLLSLGRLLVPAEAAEGDAAAIYPDIQLVDGGKDYYRTSAKYLVRTGTGKLREVVRDGVEMRHPDARVEFEKSHRLLGEYKQAKGRLRAVRADQKKLMLNLCNVSTGEPVDMLVDNMSDLIGLPRMASIMERQMGCLVLRPKYLHDTFPEYFETYESAKQFVADVREWWNADDRRFFLMVHEQPEDITAGTTWRKGYRKGATKSEGTILRIRFWDEVRHDPDLGHEEVTRVKDFVLPTPGADMTHADTY